MLDKDATGGGLVPLHVPPHLYEDMVRHLASLLAGPTAAGSVYARDGVFWTADDIREFAAAAEKWPFAVRFLRVVAQRAPKPIDVGEITLKLGEGSASIGGRLSGLGKWVKKRGKVRPGTTDATVWPFELSYDRTGRAIYRMDLSVASLVLETLGLDD